MIGRLLDKYVYCVLGCNQTLNLFIKMKKTPKFTIFADHLLDHHNFEIQLVDFLFL